MDAGRSKVSNADVQGLTKCEQKQAFKSYK